MPRDTKSKSTQSPATPAETLAKLNGYMVAAGYADDHPWRAEIAAGLSNTPLPSADMQQGVVLHAPFGKFHVGDKLDLEDHVGMRADQLSAMLLLIHGEGFGYFSRLNDNAQQSFLWQAFQLSAEIVDMLPFLTVREGVGS